MNLHTEITSKGLVIVEKSMERLRILKQRREGQVEVIHNL